MDKPTLLLVRPQQRQAADRAVCEAAGWQVLPFAPLRIEADSAALQRLPERLHAASAVFWTSPTAVETAAAAWGGCLDDLNSLLHIAVGSGSAAALRLAGIRQAYCPEHGNDSEAVAQMPLWQSLVAGSKVVLVGGHDGRDWLRQTLLARGLAAEAAAIYRRVPQALDWQAFAAMRPRAAWVTSAQMAEQVFRQAPPSCTQAVKSLLYFSHHERIADALTGLGAQSVTLCPDIAAALGRLSATEYIQ